MSDYSTEFGFCSFLHVGVVDDGEDEDDEAVEGLWRVERQHREQSAQVRASVDGTASVEGKASAHA